MKKKIVGIFVCVLLIVAAVIPVAGLLGAGNIKIRSTPSPMAITTYIDEISPYNQHSSPLTITATGPSDLDYVELYYRWSKDNSSWEGISEYTIFEGFESGSQNTSLWNTHQEGSSQARIQWDYGTSHSGSFSCAMDDYDSGGDNALNIIYTNFDFTDATEISIDFWEREWGDEPHNPIGDSWQGWGAYDLVAYTNDGTTWYQIVSESQLNVQEFINFEYDIHEHYAFSSPADSNFMISFQQIDNAALTNDGRAWDDIYINYTIGGGIDWTYWANPNNPDFSYPWSWNFNFPNGTGYYEFYSLGTKTGENPETPPLVADARCRFNHMPEIFDENPPDGSTGVELIPQLNISISDAEGETMSINWYSNSSGSWQAFGSNTSVEDGTYRQTNSNFSEFGTTYWWYVSVTDDIYTNSSPIFHFTTKVNYPPYTPSDPDPEDDETDVSVGVDLSWSGGDPNGDSVTYDVYFGDSNPPPKVKSHQSGTTYNPGTLDFDTEYFWKIVAWDEYGLSTSGPVWSFTTEENLPPNTPSDPVPENGATDVYFEIILRWTGGDPNDGDIITYSVYLGKSSPPPLVDEVNTDRYDPGILELNAMYYWQIIAEDNGGLTSTGPIWSFTTEKEPNAPPKKPYIYGPHRGPPGVELCWAFDSDDPDENPVKYIIEWGDGNSDETEYSTMTVEACHTYEEQGEFTIKAKAIDTKDAESEWATIEVTMPKNKPFIFNFPLLNWLFERFPNAFPIFRNMLGL